MKKSIVILMTGALIMVGCTSGGNYKINQSSDPILYECSICDLHFESKELATNCVEWCKNNDTCNLEIARQSIEARKGN